MENGSICEEQVVFVGFNDGWLIIYIEEGVMDFMIMIFELVFVFLKVLNIEGNYYVWSIGSFIEKRW